METIPTPGDFKGMGNNQMLIADTNTGKIKKDLWLAKKNVKLQD